MPLPASNDVKGWTIDRGRNYELDKFEAGTATITLDNRTGKYDPTNPASPYVGHIFPLKPGAITIAKPGTSTFYPLFVGFAESWDFSRVLATGADAVLNLMDGMEILARSQIAPEGTQPKGGAFYGAAHVDDRIKAALGDASWPAGKTTIATGNVDVQDITYDPGTSHLEVIQDAVDAEFPGLGAFFIGKDGFVDFRGRNMRLHPSTYEAAITGDRVPNERVMFWTLGDDGYLQANPGSTAVPISDCSFTFDKEKIYNSSLMLPNGVADTDVPGQRVQAAASIAKYGLREYSLDGLLTLQGDDGSTALQETKKFAQFWIDNLKSPHAEAPRVEQVTVKALLDPDATGSSHLWLFLLKVELGDVVTLNTVHPGGGGITAQPYFVEGLHYTCDYTEVADGVGDGTGPGSLTLVLDLSPKVWYDDDTAGL